MASTSDPVHPPISSHLAACGGAEELTSDSTPGLPTAHQAERSGSKASLALALQSPDAQEEGARSPAFQGGPADRSIASAAETRSVLRCARRRRPLFAPSRRARRSRRRAAAAAGHARGHAAATARQGADARTRRHRARRRARHPARGRRCRRRGRREAPGGGRRARALHGAALGPRPGRQHAGPERGAGHRRGGLCWGAAAARAHHPRCAPRPTSAVLVRSSLRDGAKAPRSSSEAAWAAVQAHRWWRWGTHGLARSDHAAALRAGLGSALAGGERPPDARRQAHRFIQHFQVGGGGRLGRGRRLWGRAAAFMGAAHQARLLASAWRGAGDVRPPGSALGAPGAAAGVRVGATRPPAAFRLPPLQAARGERTPQALAVLRAAARTCAPRARGAVAPWWGVQDVEQFCRAVLLDTALVAYLSQHCTCWAGDIKASDAHAVSVPHRLPGPAPRAATASQRTPAARLANARAALMLLTYVRSSPSGWAPAPFPSLPFWPWRATAW